jgi:hypothetical protein
MDQVLNIQDILFIEPELMHGTVIGLRINKAEFEINIFT